MVFETNEIYESHRGLTKFRPEKNVDCNEWIPILTAEGATEGTSTTKSVLSTSTLSAHSNCSKKGHYWIDAYEAPHLENILIGQFIYIHVLPLRLIFGSLAERGPYLECSTEGLNKIELDYRAIESFPPSYQYCRWLIKAQYIKKKLLEFPFLTSAMPCGLLLIRQSEKS